MKAQRWRSDAAATALLFLIAIPLGLLGRALVGGNAAERGVALSAALFAASAAALFLLWQHSRRWSFDVTATSFAVAAIALSILVASWFSAHLSEVLYRADILIWSESPFLNDIIRFRAGQPLYGPPADLSSFYYTPGSQMLTYGIASAFGAGDSVVALRMVQVGYVGIAVYFGLRTARRLSGASESTGLPWGILWAPLLFLAATNSLTNPYTHLLHNDALAILHCAVAFWVLVEYQASPRKSLLIAMVLVVPAGFLVKQSLAIWCVLYGFWLLFFDRRPRFWRALWVGGVGLLMTLALFGLGLVLWKADFRYWVVEGLAKHAVSPLRAVQHGLDGWAYWVAGFLACVVLVRGERAFRLFGLWLVWALLFAAETYTSGIAWMLNHMGPGSFLAIVLLAAALPVMWPFTGDVPRGWAWMRAGLVCGMLLLFTNGLRAFNLPLPALSTDAERYAAEVEREFGGIDPAQILLDHGSWLYLKDNIVQTDRSAPAGEAGWTQTADFSAMMRRLRSQAYRRILVRDLNGPEFMYDYGLWTVSSGVRDSLLTHYEVVRTIGAVVGADSPWLRDISVLEPKSRAGSRREGQ